MRGDSSMRVSGLFYFEDVFLVLGNFPLFDVGWIGFIELPGFGEKLNFILSSLASPSFYELGTCSCSFNPMYFKK
jgi:hypothetical protein